MNEAKGGVGINGKFPDSSGESPPTIMDLFSSSVQLAALLDHLPVGLAVLDTNRRIMLVNRALEALTGFTRDEIWGLPCADVLRSSICHQQCPFADSLSGGESESLEGDIINRDRRKIPVRISSKPLRGQSDDIVGFLETIEDISHLRQAAEKLNQAYRFGAMIGHSAKMEELFRIMPIIAQTDSSVLITGETGTGKDLAAEAIHQTSVRAREAFIKINCGALPETLMESELFGHKKGAFTGAVTDKPGRIRLAHKGTVYLTEIGDLPLALQVKLLTFLDDKIVYPLGTTKGFQADVRVVAATHRNLEQMVREGVFREDLLFRLNVVRLHLPPLREREGDIGLLMDNFLSLFSARFNKKIKGFSTDVRRILLSYPFPGNVRELRNAVEYAVNICQDDQIMPEHLPAYLLDPQRTARLADEKSASHAGHSPQRTMGTSVSSWAEIERQMILDALLKAKGRKNRAAQALGWGRSTLWRKIKQYGLES